MIAPQSDGPGHFAEVAGHSVIQRLYANRVPDVRVRWHAISATATGTSGVTDAAAFDAKSTVDLALWQPYNLGELSVFRNV
jgi:hypothetical protein